jgi:hypothetical protein
VSFPKGLTVAALFGVLSGGVASAQVVRIRTVDAQTRAPVAGALVSLRTEGRVAVAQTLSNEQGWAVLRAPTPGTYHLRADRIGFPGVNSEPFQLVAGDTLSARLSLPSIRIRLPDLTVHAGQSVCRLDENAGTLMAELWSEARKALAGTWITRADRRQLLDVSIYERDLNIARQVVDERSSGYQTSSLAPFRTVPAESLSLHGYVQKERDESLTFYAPDADLLLSDRFVEDHCFKVTTAKDDPAVVRLAFEPVPARRRLPEVKGTLWLDRESAALRSLDFSYTNLDDDKSSDDHWGRVEFTALPNGAWIVSRWTIRAGLKEGGGTALAARDGDQHRAVLHGVVFDSLAGAPLAGAIVSIAGGAYTDTTDASGEYQIETPTQGNFLVTFQHPRLALLGVPAAASAALTRGQRTRVDLAVPGSPTLVAKACRTRPMHLETEALLVGQVADTAGNPLVGRVVVQWNTVGLLRPGYRTVVGERGTRLLFDTDLAGRFWICGIPTGVEVKVLGGPERRPVVALTTTPAAGEVIATQVTIP